MQEIPCSGIFVAIGNEPNVSLFENSVALDGRYVDADETTRTNLPGVFAVGDVRKKAAAPGCDSRGGRRVASHFVEEYLSQHDADR